MTLKNRVAPALLLSFFIHFPVHSLNIIGRFRLWSHKYPFNITAYNNLLFLFLYTYWQGELVRPLNHFGVLRTDVAYLFNIFVMELLTVRMAMTRTLGFVQLVWFKLTWRNLKKNLEITWFPKCVRSRGKSLLELWVTTFLPNWQPPLIFVWFILKSHEHKPYYKST